MSKGASHEHCIYRPYNRDYRRVGEIVGSRNLITDKEKMEHYSHDETSAEEYGHMPEVVLTPLNVGRSLPS